DYSCPSYIANEVFCRGGAQTAYATEEIGSRTDSYTETKRLYNGIAKLQFNINPDHNIQVGYIASPTTFEGYQTLSPFTYSNVPDLAYSQTDQVHDAMVRYVGKLLGRKLQLDVMYGFHYQNIDQRPNNVDQQQYSYLTSSANPYSLADFESLPECQRQTI